MDMTVGVEWVARFRHLGRDAVRLSLVPSRVGSRRGWHGGSPARFTSATVD